MGGFSYKSKLGKSNRSNSVQTKCFLSLPGDALISAHSFALALPPSPRERLLLSSLVDAHATERVARTLLQEKLKLAEHARKVSCLRHLSQPEPLRLPAMTKTYNQQTLWNHDDDDDDDDDCAGAGAFSKAAAAALLPRGGTLQQAPRTRCPASASAPASPPNCGCSQRERGCLTTLEPGLTLACRLVRVALLAQRELRPCAPSLCALTEQVHSSLYSVLREVRTNTHESTGHQEDMIAAA
eukprot:1149420-Rhodomonas_salina.1